MAEAVSGQNLRYFFMQWIESSGAPEFKLEYTIYRARSPKARAVSRDGQSLAGSGHFPHAGRSEDRDRRQSGGAESGSCGHFDRSSPWIPSESRRTLLLDPTSRVLHYSDQMRVAVAIRRGEQFAEVSEFNEALKEYQKALEVNRGSSLAHYRIAEIFFLQNNYQAAANEFREVLNGRPRPEVDRSLGAPESGQDLRYHRPARARGQRVQRSPSARRTTRKARRKKRRNI